MPFISTIGTVGSQPGSVVLAAAGLTLWSGPVWNMQPFLEVTVNGTVLPHTTSATLILGLDVVVMSATIELTENPHVPDYAEVVVVAGNGPHNVQRFKGLVLRTRENLWPHSFTLVCRGMLYRAYKYKQSKGAAVPSFINQRLPIVGLSVFDLMQIDPAPSDNIERTTALQICTDQNYVLAVLNRVPDLQQFVDPGDINGTGHVFGTLAWRDLTWQPHVSALSQCQKFDEVSLGFRLFESLNARIMRSQVFPYPTGSADTEFTEGIDVLSAIGERSVEDLTNAEYVEGYSLGGLPGLINAYAAEDNPFQSSSDPYIDNFNSPLIEDLDFAAQIRDWRLAERNRQTVDVSFTTFRDDLLIPGREVAINLPHANVTETVWMQHIEIQIRNKPVSFRQSVRGFGGGLSFPSIMGSTHRRSFVVPELPKVLIY